GVLLDLRTAEGQVIGQRLLDRDSSCADLAAAAAVVVAVWQSDAAPEFSSDVDGMSLRGAAPQRESPATYDLGAAGLLAVGLGTESPRAPGLGLVGSWTFGEPGETARAGLRAVVTGTAEHEQALAPGAVRWRRVTAGLGPHLRLSPAGPSSAKAWRWHLDLHAEAFAGHLRVRGVNFPTNRPSTSYEPGAGAGARLMLHRGKTGLWLDVSMVRWLREQVAVTTATAGAGEMMLPRNEALLALGVAFCACR
ncbi:MAG TPA: hypothetical protein VGG33_15590, partial [Polyangia bacterium]